MGKEVFRKEIDSSERCPGVWTIEQVQEWFVIKHEGVEQFRTDGDFAHARHLLFNVSCH